MTGTCRSGTSSKYSKARLHRALVSLGPSTDLADDLGGSPQVCLQVSFPSETGSLAMQAASSAAKGTFTTSSRRTSTSRSGCSCTTQTTTSLVKRSSCPTVLGAGKDSSAAESGMACSIASRNRKIVSNLLRTLTRLERTPPNRLHRLKRSTTRADSLASGASRRTSHRRKTRFMLLRHRGRREHRLRLDRISNRLRLEGRLRLCHRKTPATRGTCLLRSSRELLPDLVTRLLLPVHFLEHLPTDSILPSRNTTGP